MLTVTVRVLAFLLVVALAIFSLLSWRAWNELQDALENPPPLLPSDDALHSLFSTNYTGQFSDTKRKSINATAAQDEKFVTFYPHSGFQNQLIQVENAIMLAWYTNRTLLLPRALLGKPFPWSPMSQLRLEHLLHEKTPDGSNSAACDALEEERGDQVCPNPAEYTLMPYDELFSFDWVRAHVRIQLREEMSEEWLEKAIGVKRAGVEGKDGSYVDGDIRYFNGTTRYDWRIFDTSVGGRSNGKYEDRLDVMQLQAFPERLLHFSSLFGSGKMPVRDPVHFEFLRRLRRSLLYNHPVVLKSAEEVVQRMGGAGKFVGLHVRTSDGIFAKVQQQNIETILENLHAVNATAGLPSIPPSLPPKPTLSQCLQAASEAGSNLTLVYMATDARYPRANRIFAPLYSAYPCTFTLGDFLKDNGINWKRLRAARNPYDGVALERYFLPMIDATAAANGRVVIGSRGSTFSGFVYQMHDVLCAERKVAEWVRERAV